MKRNLAFKYVTFIIIFLLLNVSSFNISAQNTHLYTAEELSSSRSKCIVQDKYGFIWIGTEYGLNRFDGYRFTKYYSQVNDSTSLNSHEIMAMLFSKDGDLWIGCSNGLCRYDYSKNIFKRYHFPNNESPRVTDIIETESGEVLLGTAGFGLYNIKEDKVKQMIQPNEKEDKGIYSRIFIDEENSLWYSGYMSKLICTKFNKSKNAIKIIDNKYGFVTSFIDLGKEGFLAVGNWGIMRYDYLQHKLLDTDYDLSALNNIKIHSAIMGENGNMYLGTSGKGLYVIYSGTKKAQRLSKKGKNLLPDCLVNYILEDNNHNIWLSCYRSGLYEINNKVEPFTYCSIDDVTKGSGDNISSIVEGRDNGVIVGLYNGDIYNISSNGEIKEELICHNNINSMIRDKDGRYWLSGSNKIYEYDDVRKKVIEKYANNNLDIYHLSSDNRGRLFYCLVGYGMGIYDTKTGKNTIVKSSGDVLKGKNTLCNAWIQHFMVDSHGIIWISTASGICCYNPNTNSFAPYGWNVILHGTLCFSTIEIKDGKVLISTEHGIYIYDRKNGKVLRSSKSSQLNNLRVYCMILDSSGDLWLSSSKGIWHYNSENSEFVSHENDYGLKGKEYIPDAVLSLDDNKMVFGSDRGIVFFNPYQVKSRKDELSDINLVSFYIDGEWRDFRDNHFDIPWGSNSFTMEFSKLMYDNTENVIYQYRTGKKEAWISSEEGKNSFNFNKVQPGDYYFEVRAYVNGYYSPVKTIHVRVLSPWYTSWWAFVIYAFIIMIAVVCLYYFYRNRLENRYEEQKMKFLINATHDIRSPLTLIMGPLKKLRATVKDDESKHYIDIIGRNADRMLTLVTQILDVRKIDKKQMEIKCEPTDMVALVNGICTLFQFNAHERSISIKQNNSKKEIEVYVDRSNFEKVITNLLSNAMKYTFDGGEIDIDLSVDKNMFILKISDNGIGISQNDISKVFNRFYQGENSRGYNIGGTGIGLNLCKQLVELHQGVIKVGMREDGKRGTCFTVMLQLGSEHLKSFQIKALDNINSTVTKSGKSNNKFKILVADDDMEVARYVKLELEEWYRVDIVSNGKDAINALLNEHYDIFISDIMMPVMDGVTLLRRIKGNPNISDIPVILLTSKSEVEDRLDGIRHGADAFISKPFSIDELHVTVDNLVNNVRRLKGKFSGSQSQEGKVENVEMKNNNDDLMDKIMKSVNEKYTNSDYNVEGLAADLSISRVQLHRRMKEITGLSSSEFIRNIRIQQAARLIKEKRVNVSQIAYAVGFNSPAHFSTLFKKYYGVTPSEYAERHI